MTVLHTLHNKMQLKSRLHLFITKSDIFDSTSDKHKVLCQITQGVTSKLGAEHGFEMPMIYIPTAAGSSTKKTCSHNDLDSLCILLKQTSEFKAQYELTKANNHVKNLKNQLNE
jgi:hypothetical protein